MDNLKIADKNAILELLEANSYTVDIIKIIIGGIAIFASAQIYIPIPPVPITMHSVMISIIAFTYSPRLSFLTLLSFITIGIMGLPVFSKFSSGLNYFLGATGGYYLGFLIATPIMSTLKSKLPQSLMNIAMACIVGHTIIYLCGVSWLAIILGLKQALYSGFIIFIPSGLIKIFIFLSLFFYINKTKK